jgi:hypothetical protein
VFQFETQRDLPPVGNQNLVEHFCLFDDDGRLAELDGLAGSRRGSR